MHTLEGVSVSVPTTPLALGYPTPGLRYYQPEDVFAATKSTSTRFSVSANPFVVAMDTLAVQEKMHRVSLSCHIFIAVDDIAVRLSVCLSVCMSVSCFACLFAC